MWHRGLVFIVIALTLNFPALTTMINSFRKRVDIQNSPLGFFSFEPTLEHYQKIFEHPTFHFQEYLLNSLALSISGTLIALCVGFPASYAIARFGYGRQALLTAMSCVRALPLIVFAVPIYLLFQIVGLLDSRLGLALIACLINLPLVVFVLLAHFQELPTEIDEAARVFGANTLQIIMQIMLPLSGSALAAVGILSFINAWNEYLFGVFLTSKSATPISVGATFFATNLGVDWGVASAVLILSVLPPLLLGLVSYRYIGRSLTAGAVKG